MKSEKRMPEKQAVFSVTARTQDGHLATRVTLCFGDNTRSDVTVSVSPIRTVSTVQASGLALGRGGNQNWATWLRWIDSDVHCWTDYDDNRKRVDFQ